MFEGEVEWRSAEMFPMKREEEEIKFERKREREKKKNKNKKKSTGALQSFLPYLLSGVQ